MTFESKYLSTWTQNSLCNKENRRWNTTRESRVTCVSIGEDTRRGRGHKLGQSPTMP
jgi:hypothetical protein